MKLLKEKSLSVPEIVMIAGTRVALGLGIGLLVASKLNSDQRKAAGLSLFCVGLVSTVPIVMNIIGRNR